MTLVVCCFLIFRWRDIYARPEVAVAVAAAMVVVTAAVCWLALQGRAHSRVVVAADVLVTVVLTLATIWAQTREQRVVDGMPTLTTVWAAGPVLEVAVVSGWLGGALASLVQLGAAILVREGYDGRTLTSGLLLMIAGTVTGYVATLVVRAEAALAAATAARAAAAERERLARSIHDGTLQVLALVSRRGRDAGGEWTALAAAAREQEVALRRLMTTGREHASATHRDLVAALRTLESDRVSVATPAGELLLDGHVADEIVAAVRAALDNVERHAGADASAWVLLDALDDAVRLTVRDDGCGFDADRVDRAAASGRIGLRSSILGRVQDLGGEVAVSSRPGAGTTIDITVPLR